MNKCRAKTILCICLMGCLSLQTIESDCEHVRLFPEVWTFFGYKPSRKKKKRHQIVVEVIWSEWIFLPEWTLSHYPGRCQDEHYLIKCCLSGNGHLRRQWSFKVSNITRKIYNCNINCIRCSQHEPRGLAKFRFRQLLCVSLITLLLLLPSPRSFKETQFSSLCKLASNGSLLQVCYLKLQRDPVAERTAGAALVQGHPRGCGPSRWHAELTHHTGRHRARNTTLCTRVNSCLDTEWKGTCNINGNIP